MTAPNPRHPQVLDRPACTPSAIRAVLAANADAAVLRRYDAELDAAYEQARDDGDLTTLARIERYQREGPTPAAERISWQEIRAEYGL
jgi:hypothetical protein